MPPKGRTRHKKTDPPTNDEEKRIDAYGMKNEPYRDTKFHKVIDFGTADAQPTKLVEKPFNQCCYVVCIILATIGMLVHSIAVIVAVRRGDGLWSDSGRVSVTISGIFGTILCVKLVISFRAKRRRARLTVERMP